MKQFFDEDDLMWEQKLKDEPVAEDTEVPFGCGFCWDKRKKTDKHYISEYIRYDDGVGIKGTMNNQIVYKVNGDFNGNIKGDNVTVVLMGNGNFNGNVDSNDGNVVLIKGSINGDVKANKIVCPTEQTTDNNTTKHNPAKDVESPKLPVKTPWSCDIPSNNNECSKCAFARKMPYLSLSGINTSDEYNCLKFNKIVDSNYCCRDFIDLKTIENLNNRINDIINRK